MNYLRFKLGLPALLLAFTSIGQTTLTYKHIGIGNSSNVLSGSANLQFDNGVLTMGSTTDNYLGFSNPAGTSYFQNDGYGNFAWWTPQNGTRKMMLTNSGNLLLGTTSDLGYKLSINGSANAISYSLNDQGLSNRILFKADPTRVYISKTTYGTLGHFHVKQMDPYANVLDPSVALATFDVNGENIAQAGSNQAYNATSVNVNASSMMLTNSPYSALGQYVMKGIQVRAKQQVQTTYQSPYTANSQAFGIKINTMNDDAGYWANGSYGLYIDATAAKPNTAYAIYSNTGLNYFADKLLLGNAASLGEYKLQVSGSLLLNGQTVEPAGVNGGIFYNSSANQFKGYRNGQWKNFLMEGDASSGSSNWSITGTTIFNSNSGNVGIGTTDTKGYKFAVNGDAIFTKVKVKQYPWADYVFNDGYKLLTLEEVEEYIKKHKHLPEVPSAKEVEENGLDVGENQATLLKKIEELTLYIIEQDKKIEKLQLQNKELLDIRKELEFIKAKIQN